MEITLPFKIVVLSIDDYLRQIEVIFDRHIRIDDEDLLWFTPMRREPLISSNEIPRLSVFERNRLSHTPYSPWKCLLATEEIIYTNLYSNSLYSNLYKDNNILRDTFKCFNYQKFLAWNKEEDILRHYLPLLTETELLYLGKLYNTLIRSMRDAIASIHKDENIDLGYIYVLNYTSHTIYLELRSDIWRYRYEELMKYTERMNLNA